MCQKYSKDIPSVHDPLRTWDGLTLPDWYYETDFSEGDDEEDEIRSIRRQQLGHLRLLGEILLVTSGILTWSFIVYRWI
jgi:hypothetical protein